MNAETETSTDLEFTVLQDKPLENGEVDSFGHGEIADSVVRVIKKAPKPFNIGIYGQWGVGKSTICKIVEERLYKEEGYKVVYFDTWKYERDSFRRQFLITLDEKLDLGFNYKETLNQSLTVPFNLSWFENTKLVLGDVLFKGFTLLIVGLIVLFFIKEAIVPFLISPDYIGLAKKIIDLGIIGILANFILDSIKQFQGEKTVDKTDSAEGFEEHFSKVLHKIHGKNLLVIIDNLDRLSSEKAVSLLSDIKTFLSDEKYGGKIKNNTVFVIPCDNKAINNQLLKEYGEEFDTEEYLRKFFNHSVQIPKFLDIELDDFIVGKLNKTNIKEFENNYDLVFILSNAFRNNPREIIQFINSLISLYLLGKERKIDRVVEAEHIAFLAKILVIRVKWPRSYDLIEDRVLRSGEKLQEIVQRINADTDSNSRKKLEDFLRATHHISDDEYQDIYFSLRQSEAQKTIPEWNSFVLSLLETRKADAEKIYNTIKSNNKLPQLGQLLVDFCRKNSSNENSLFNIFLTAHKIIQPEDIKHFQEVFLLTFKSVVGGRFNSTIENVELKPFFSKGLDGISPANKKDFSQNLISMIGSISSIDTIEREKIKHVRDLFEIVNSEENKDNFKQKHNQIAEIKKDLFSHIKFQELFPETQKGVSFRKDILNDILDILTKLGPTDDRHYQVGLTLFGNLLQWPPIVEEDELRIKVLEISLEFLDKSKPPTSDPNGIVGTILNTFTTRISTWYSGNKGPDERAICVKIFQKINLDININKEPEASVNRYITETVNNPDVILETLGKDFLIENDNARKGLMNRSRTTTDLLSKLPLKRKLNDEEKAEILAHLIGNPKEAMTFLEYVGLSVPQERNGDKNFLKGIVQRMIDSAGLSDTDLLNKWLDAISKFGIQADQVEPFVQKLRQVRNQSEQHKKTIGEFVTNNSKEFGDLIVKEFNE